MLHLQICYGKVPVYLRRNKQQVTAERDAFDTYMKMREQPVSHMSVCASVILLDRHEHWNGNTALQSQPWRSMLHIQKGRADDVAKSPLRAWHMHLGVFWALPAWCTVEMSGLNGLHHLGSHCTSWRGHCGLCAMSPGQVARH